MYARGSVSAPRNVLSFTSREVLRFKIWLTEYPNGRGGTLSGIDAAEMH